MRSLRTLSDVLLDAFAPMRCSGCDRVAQDAICPGCMRALDALPAPGPVRRDGATWIAAYEYADPLRVILHHAKYRAGRGSLEALAAAASARLLARCRLRGDALVPVPLGRRRLRQRGYNQAEVVARALAAAFDLAVVAGLGRVRDTQPQAEKDRDARRRNVAGAFAWSGRDLHGARLWLVDDVVTTGATAAAATSALLSAGASQVNVVAVASVG